jgi:hypothetical protein
MLLVLIGCLMVKDPSVSPEIEDFYMDSSPSFEVDTGIDTGLDLELNISVESGILSVEHNSVYLPCNTEVEPMVVIDSFTVTVTYSEEEDPDCRELFDLTYSINMQEEELGTYSFTAHEATGEFVLE